MASPMSSPQTGIRPVPGAQEGGGSPPPDASGDLSSLAGPAPQTGPDESQARQGLINQVKQVQEMTGNIARIDPTFGKIAQQIDKLLYGYLTNVARKMPAQGRMQ
jgi:hypothetical protein